MNAAQRITEACTFNRIAEMLPGLEIEVPHEAYGTERAAVTRLLQAGNAEGITSDQEGFEMRDVTLEIGYVDNKGLPKTGTVTGVLAGMMTDGDDGLTVNPASFRFQAYIDGPDET